MNPKKIIQVGPVNIGGESPISIQSMLSCHPAKKQEAFKQIRELEEVGCQIIRIAVPDFEAVEAIPSIIEYTKIPIIADVHFNPAIAQGCIQKGIHKLRLNPSNIKDEQAIRLITRMAKERNIPIRVGVNRGSIHHSMSTEDVLAHMKKILRKEILLLETEDFTSIVISAKCSDPLLNFEMNQWVYDAFPYPIHLGLTEAGPLVSGAIKSAFALRPLLERGIGNTIRVSLTGEIANEVYVAKYILQALHKRAGLNIISCPTCGRCKWDVKRYVDRLEKQTAKLNKTMTVAIMGCEVNGPGEASEATIGMAGSNNRAVLFCKGEIQQTGSTEEIFSLLMERILLMPEEETHSF